MLPPGIIYKESTDERDFTIADTEHIYRKTMVAQSSSINEIAPQVIGAEKRLSPKIMNNDIDVKKLQATVFTD